VQVSRVDLDGRKIDFRMVTEAESDRPAPRGERARPAVNAVEELAGVREADRLAKGVARSYKGADKGKPGKAATDAARRSRKPAPKRPAPKPRTRR
jgi:ribonuclease R